MHEASASAPYSSDYVQYVTAMDGLLDHLTAAMTTGWQGPMVVCFLLGPSIHRPKELYVVRFCNPQGIPWKVSCAGMHRVWVCPCPDMGFTHPQLFMRVVLVQLHQPKTTHACLSSSTHCHACKYAQKIPRLKASHSIACKYAQNTQ